MKKADVIIIGAGAAGLMAARMLGEAGKTVIVLEARNRTGGRIHTIEQALFFNHAELGAEFVHGNLPVTLGLLKEAGLQTEPAEGEMWRFENGNFNQNDTMGDGWALLMQKLNDLQHDMSLNEFLNQYFPGDEFNQLKTSVRQYLSGYDTGDPDKASVFALRQEWQNEDEGAQHRIKGGYCALINHLQTSGRKAGVSVYLNEPVTHINWQAGQVTITTATAEQYIAGKVIVAVPLGVLQQSAELGSAIQFEPAVPDYTAALHAMGFGAIIKVLLQFDQIFWVDNGPGSTVGANLEHMEFLFSSEVIPTWWTQSPQQSPLLTGWLGGGEAEKIKGLTNGEILDLALQSLSNIFKLSIDDLKGKLIAWHVANWSADPYTRGSYAYDTVASAASRKLLSQDISQTILFAGEYMYEGPAMGTVEAALVSGQQVASHILNYI